jgi:hypothetical protein
MAAIINHSQEIFSHSRQQLKVLNKFRKRLEKEKYINNYASNYYGNMHNRFSIPGIIVSGVSSVASFLATSDMMSDTSKTAISIGVGILAAGSTIIYSIANSYGFQSRRDAFQMSADAYDDLITRIEFEIVNPNENFNEFCNSLESQILKIKTDCKYLPPLFIYKMYEEESRKMKLAGLDEEHEASLDFVMVDNSPVRGGVPATPVTQSTNKQIKLPSSASLIGAIQETPAATYFNDLATPVLQPVSQPGLQLGQAMTTVNKLAAGGLAEQVSIPTTDTVSTIINIPCIDLSSQQTHRDVSINLTNMDGADMDGVSSI